MYTYIYNRVTDERSERLKAGLEKQSLLINSGQTVDTSQLSSIYEDLHWLVLISGKKMLY